MICEDNLTGQEGLIVVLYSYVFLSGHLVYSEYCHVLRQSGVEGKKTVIKGNAQTDCINNSAVCGYSIKSNSTGKSSA